MNPLDLAGPEFLRFYAQFGVVALVLAWGGRLLLERDAPALRSRWAPGRHPAESDAYHVAFLRGRTPAVVDALLTRLVAADRIAIDGTVVRVSDAQPAGEALPPIERRAVSVMRDGMDILAAATAVTQAVTPSVITIAADLGAAGLAWLPERRRAQVIVAVVGGVVILGVAAAKLAVAWSRGQSNVIYLLLLAGVFTVGLRLAVWPRRATPLGREYLAWLKSSHPALLQMVGRRGQASAGEAALATAIFGFADTRGPMIQVKQAFRTARRKTAGGDGFASSCGSGSSCGSASCGGGGGGGCGGCGG